jgi:hypothetical protein
MVSGNVDTQDVDDMTQGGSMMTTKKDRAAAVRDAINFPTCSVDLKSTNQLENSYF